MPRSVHSVLSAVVLLTLGACAIHEAEPVFRATAFIGDRGISVPLPPPSLLNEPQQEVHVQGSVLGFEGGGEELRVHLLDQVGGEAVEVPLTEEATFEAEGLLVDLTRHCLELWVEDAEGQEGEHLTYQAVIGDDDQTISVVEGCD